MGAWDGLALEVVSKIQRAKARGVEFWLKCEIESKEPAKQSSISYVLSRLERVCIWLRRESSGGFVDPLG
jgi:predicted transcriptional regulator